MATDLPLACPICKSDVTDMDGHLVCEDNCPTRFMTVVPRPDQIACAKRKAKVVQSDGGSSAYYKLPPQATDLMDLIEAEEMSFARGNMFKALFRLGKKAGTDVEYDLNKLQWFLDRMREMHTKGQRL